MIDRGQHPRLVGRGSSAGLSRMVASGSLWLIGSRVLRTGLSVLGLAILARLLSPTDFGVLVVALTFALFGTGVLTGLIDTPVTRHADLSDTELRSLIWVGLVGMLLLSSLLWIAAAWLERWLDFPHLALAIRAVTPIMVLQTYIVAGTAVLRRMHRFRSLAAISILNIIFYIAPAIAMAWMGFGLWSLLAGQIASALATALICIHSARLPLLPPRRINLEHVGQTGWYGLGANLLDFGWTSADTLAVGTLLGPAATGLYSRAYNIGTQLKEPFAAFDSTIRQALTKIDSESTFERELRRILRLATIASALLASGVSVARDELVALLLGANFAASAPILGVLVLALPARVAVLTIDGATVAKGSMPNILLRAGIMFAILAPSVFIVATYGVLAVAVAVATASWIGAIVAVYLFAQQRKRSFPRLLATLLPGLLIGLATGVAAEILLMEIGSTFHFAARLMLVMLLFAGVLALCAALVPEGWLPRAAAVARRNFARATRRSWSQANR